MPAALSRRTLLAAAAAAVAPGHARAAPTHEITVYKTPWCGCCRGWLTHLTRAGFRTKVVEVEDLAPVRARHAVPFELSSCHTGVSGGYVFEGHVPPADMLRLLRQKPKAIGLAVPGMPLGSPGMESPTGQRESYATLLLLKGGGTQVFARH